MVVAGGLPLLALLAYKPTTRTSLERCRDCHSYVFALNIAVGGRHDAIGALCNFRAA
jgi:hypothetical protein